MVFLVLTSMHYWAPSVPVYMCPLLTPPSLPAMVHHAAAGTDLEMGTDYWNSSMLSAVSKGLVTEETVGNAAYRGLLQRIRCAVVRSFHKQCSVKE
jgi:hypothetical protein